LPAKAPLSHIEISKHILKGSEGSYGLRHWPEINPKSIKDKAYLVFKKEKKPLHFTGVAYCINNLSWLKSSSKANAQTVHNELIKDPRFVLIGRGLYALRDWGYEPGTVRDVISKLFLEEKRALTKAEVVRRVLKKRHVGENTIILNLQNKNYFQKNPQGKYTIRIT